MLLVNHFYNNEKKNIYVIFFIISLINCTKIVLKHFHFRVIIRSRRSFPSEFQCHPSFWVDENHKRNVNYSQTRDVKKHCKTLEQLNEPGNEDFQLNVLKENSTQKFRRFRAKSQQRPSIAKLEPISCSLLTLNCKNTHI